MLSNILLHLLTYISYIQLISSDVHTKNIEIEKNTNKLDNLNNELTSVPTSCIGLDDGYHYIKLLQDDNDNNIKYPILYILCSNEYMIIDYEQDPLWIEYFTTWIKYHYGVVGPIRNDQSNWSKWFLPDRFAQYSITRADQEESMDIKPDTIQTGYYLVSPRCNECNLDDERQINGDKSTYYMSALAYGCFNPVRGWPACDMDFDTYECKICSWDSELTQISSYSRLPTLTWEEAVDESLKTGVCDFEIRGASDYISQSYSKCAAEGSTNINWKPSLGIDGRFCQCYKPYHQYKTHITVKQTRLNKKIKHVKQKQNDNIISSEDEEITANPFTEYKLYQTDFKDGTYRITKAGTYVIQEDIEFDFNAAPIGHPSPNNVDNNYYWPKSEDVDKYPGAGDSRDAYFLGFFAGITIECDNVILNLNGFELRMSRPFYYQQPYFSIIELSNQPFLPGQGPGFFGAEPVFASNIIIKKGTLGLSSHHAIHGNFNKDVILHDLVIKNFQTHGIQLNGFNGITLRNLEVGPSTTRAYLNGNYAQMRLLLPTLKKISNKHKNEVIRFNKRQEEVSMDDLITKLVHMMDMVLSYVIDGKQYTDDADWDEAVNVFINPTGLSMGAVLYGVFLNYPSAGIFGWHVNDANSYDAVLDNIEIHDLRHAGLEIVGLVEGGRVICNGFNGPLPAEHLFGDNIQSFGSKLYSDDFDNIEYAQYIGSIITDIHLAQYYWGRDDFNNWAGIPFYGAGDKILDWALGQHPTYISSTDSDLFGFYCNEDAMFHPAKGLLGLKISGVNGVNMKDIRVYNLQDETSLGSSLCGSIDKPKHGLYHFAQQLPYQVGFSMNMVMAVTIDFSQVSITNMDINGLYSDTGLTYGMANWFESNIDVAGEFTITNLNAGVSIDSDQYTYSDLPNKSPEACAVRMYDDDNYQLNIKWDDDLSIKQYCITGAVGCIGIDVYTHLDHITQQPDDVTCEYTMPYTTAIKDVNQLFSLKPNNNNINPPPSDRGDNEKQKQKQETITYDATNLQINDTYNILNDKITLIFVIISIFIILICSIKITIKSIIKQQNKTKNNCNQYGTF